jgi:ABC-type glutathione transport system ATPase component
MKQEVGMKTNVIEITVSGKVGCGKSEVLEVIRNALDEHLGYPRTHIKIAGVNPVGGIEEARHTRQTTRNEKTVFVLREEDF